MLICSNCFLENGYKTSNAYDDMVANHEHQACGICGKGDPAYLIMVRDPLPQPDVMNLEDLSRMPSDRLRIQQAYVEVPDYTKRVGTADFNLKTPFGQPLQAHFNYLLSLAAREGKDVNAVLEGAEILASTINEEFLGKPLVEVMLACVLHLLQIEKIAEVATLGSMTYDEAHEVLRRRMDSLDRGNFGRG